MSVTTGLRRHGGELIHWEEDAHGLLEVVDQVDLRSLHFGSPPMQSRMRRAEPATLVLDYTQAMMLPLLFRRPARVLLLGLGGGSLAKFLFHALARCRIDVVESRAAVVRLAEAFFYLPRDPRLTVTVDDAHRVVGACRHRYDLILVDLFDAWGPAPVLAELGFLGDCRACLHDDGVLAMNLWCEDRAQPAVEAHLTHLFADRCLNLSMADRDNRVVLAFQGGLPHWSLRQARQQARQLGPTLNLPLLTLVSEFRRHNRHWLTT